MTATHHRPEAIQRGTRMLRTVLGPAIARFLEDPTVIEVMLNPDGRLWLDRLSEGLADTGEIMSPVDGERIIRLVAHHVGVEVQTRSPRVSAELPESGERIEGLLPPVVAAPTFAIRKPAVAVFALDDYVAAGIMTADEAETLCVAIQSRANILELVNDIEHTELASIVGSILDEVVRPDVIAVLGPEPDAGAVVQPQPIALRLLLWDLQPLALPDPLHPLVVDQPAGPAQQRRYLAIAVAPKFAAAHRLELPREEREAANRPRGFGGPL